MRDFLLDLALPRTDAEVFRQWAIAGVFWLVVLIGVRNQRSEIRQLLWGLAIMTAAWFAFRMVH